MYQYFSINALTGIDTEYLSFFQADYDVVVQWLTAIRLFSLHKAIRHHDDDYSQIVVVEPGIPSLIFSNSYNDGEVIWLFFNLLRRSDGIPQIVAGLSVPFVQWPFAMEFTEKTHRPD